METSIPDVRLITLRENPETFDWHQRNSLSDYQLPDLQYHDEMKLRKGEIRGVHLQLRPPQRQVLRIVHGSILVVVADLRFTAGTVRSRWKPRIMTFVLSASEPSNRELLCIPPGCAQGIQALYEGSMLSRSADQPFADQLQLGIHYNDELFDRTWNYRLGITTSLRDGTLSYLNDIPTDHLPSL